MLKGSNHTNESINKMKESHKRRKLMREVGRRINENGDNVEGLKPILVKLPWYKRLWK